MSQKNSLQDLVLAELQQERQVVTVIVTNGFQMKGRITAFDENIVVVEIRNEQQIVYKHAISTLTPARPVSLGEAAQ